MSRRTKLSLAAILIVGVAGVVFALSAAKRGGRAVEVRLETVGTRSLVSAVTASGKIEAKTKVDISADITGRITHIAVKEGDIVKKGQFLIQIDPAQYQSVVARTDALVASSQASLLQAKANRDQARRSLDRALELSRSGSSLISKEAVEQSQQAYDVAVANYTSAAAQVEQSKSSLQEAKDNLSKTRLVSPIDGRVVRLSVEQGEVAVPGTFSRETGRLMTIADLSVILAKVQVNETDVVRLGIGDSVATSIDAFPDSTFVGRVTKISNSAKLASGQTTTGSNDRAVDFEVEITLQNPPAEIRPDLSTTARIVTATRKDALSIPIISLTVREHEVLPNELKPGTTATAKDSASARKGREGVFVVNNGIAMFRPVKVGIAGDEYFELLDGLKKGDSIVAGPYQAIRDLKDSTRVRPSQSDKAKSGATKTP